MRSGSQGARRPTPNHHWTQQGRRRCSLQISAASCVRAGIYLSIYLSIYLYIRWALVNRDGSCVCVVSPPVAKRPSVPSTLWPLTRSVFPRGGLLACDQLCTYARYVPPGRTWPSSRSVSRPVLFCFTLFVSLRLRLPLPRPHRFLRN